LLRFWLKLSPPLSLVSTGILFIWQLASFFTQTWREYRKKVKDMD